MKGKIMTYYYTLFRREIHFVLISILSFLSLSMSVYSMEEGEHEKNCTIYLHPNNDVTFKKIFGPEKNEEDNKKKYSIEMQTSYVEPPIYYWRDSQKRSGAEIDYTFTSKSS